MLRVMWLTSIETPFSALTSPGFLLLHRDPEVNLLRAQDFV